MNVVFRDILIELKNIRRLLERLCESKQSPDMIEIPPPPVISEEYAENLLSQVTGWLDSIKKSQ